MSNRTRETKSWDYRLDPPEGAAMFCQRCESVFSTEECPVCLRCIEAAERDARILETVVNDRAGGILDADLHSVLMDDSGKCTATYDMRIRTKPGDKAALAADLIHVAVGLLSGGLPGVAQAKACIMAANSAVYFDSAQQEELAAGLESEAGHGRPQQTKVG